MKAHYEREQVRRAVNAGVLEWIRDPDGNDERAPAEGLPEEGSCNEEAEGVRPEDHASSGDGGDRQESEGEKAHPGGGEVERPPGGECEVSPDVYTAIQERRWLEQESTMPTGARPERGRVAMHRWDMDPYEQIRCKPGWALSKIRRTYQDLFQKVASVRGGYLPEESTFVALKRAYCMVVSMELRRISREQRMAAERRRNGGTSRQKRSRNHVERDGTGETEGGHRQVRRRVGLSSPEQDRAKTCASTPNGAHRAPPERRHSCPRATRGEAEPAGRVVPAREARRTRKPTDREGIG